MVSLLEDYSYFQFDNYSVPKKDEIDAETEEELEQALREQQIKPASIVIALGGMYVAYSKWIKKEIILAKIEGKPILGVEPYGSAQTPR
jgi:type II secretory pathway component PulF